MGEAAASEQRSTTAAVAALVRVPNLFTAPPDVILGAALTAGAGTTVDPRTVAGLAVASTLLYAGGTTLNDAFDAPRDAAERPDRPIPSGDLSRQAGFGLGGTFLLLGVASAVAASGVFAGIVATLTVAGILLYDGALKGGAIGFVIMGGVRGLNVVLGSAAGGGVLPLRWYLPPIAIAAYIAAVTFMAARETQGGNRGAVAVAVTGALAATLTVGIHIALAEPDIASAGAGAALAVGFLLWTGTALREAYAEPVPETVGPAVGTCVLGLVVLDAAFAAATGVLWAFAAVAFLIPAAGLSRAFDVT